MRYFVFTIALFLSLLSRADELTDRVAELERVADSSPSELREKLESLFPQLVAQLEQDAKSPEMKAAWGRSQNFDEGVKATIVRPAIMDLVLKIARGPARDGKIVHAGLEHTYGYLLSNLNTSFGYKRERWTKGEIERGFGLPSGHLGPSPAKGTLLSNLTPFLEDIAIRGARKGRRIVETVNDGDRTVIIYTDLIPFTEGPRDRRANSHLLVYSYSDSREEGQKLVTAFPVNDGFVTDLVKPKKLGPSVAISLRYNAYLDGFEGGKGERRLLTTLPETKRE